MVREGEKMIMHHYVITIGGDVGTYKAALCHSVKKVLNASGIVCTIMMKDDAMEDSFNIFVTTSNSEFHREQQKTFLDKFHLVLNIDEISEEEATQYTIEQFAKWIT